MKRHVKKKRMDALLLQAVSNDLGPEWAEPRVARTILANSKECVEDARRSYRKWVRMLSSYGFSDIAEVLGPTATTMPDGAWTDAPDWAELRADVASHGFLHPAGTDHHGRQVLWEHGVMRCPKGREKAFWRAVTLFWLAVHTDPKTLRDGVVVVHTVGADDGRLLARNRALIASACAFPLRPQKILVAGLGPAGVALARRFIKVVFLVTRAKMLERIVFVPWKELWEHMPHASIPTLRGIAPHGFGGFEGTEHPIDWIEQRLRDFPACEKKTLIPSQECPTRG